MEWHIAIPSKNIFVLINKYLFDYFAFKMSNIAIPISPYIDTKIKKINPSLKTFLLPSITDFKKIDSIPNNVHLGEKYVLYCGNLGYMEVIDFVINSFSRIESDINLVLIVNGKQKDFLRLQEVLNQYNLIERVTILTDLSFSSLIAYYKSAVALLIPLRDSEQDLARFPHKISEYIAAKRPIITTNFGPVNEMLNANELVVSDSYNVFSYAKKIDFVCNNPVKTSSMAFNAYLSGKYIFDYESYVDRMKEFLLKT
jgi:glycosyltransferase involved in cell wall biosynthesis